MAYSTCYLLEIRDLDGESTWWSAPRISRHALQQFSEDYLTWGGSIVELATAVTGHLSWLSHVGAHNPAYDRNVDKSEDLYPALWTQPNAPKQSSWLYPSCCEKEQLSVIVENDIHDDVTLLIQKSIRNNLLNYRAEIMRQVAYVSPSVPPTFPRTVHYRARNLHQIKFLGKL